ncbi:ATP-binding protein [Streptomyces sp. NPDC060065]|uniref:ATP-binding protein n=1 Tax=Streptomyces sp. NPDC060065 TaxID=3347050 RepID=UPI0036A81217
MSAPLCERGEALDLIASEAARARNGTGRLVLLRGATGTGRTALLEAAAEHARTHGMQVLRARCSPDDSSLPLSAVRQLLGPVGEPWAIGVLRDAAADAVHDGRTHDALPFLRRALDEPLADDRRQRLLTELGSLEYAVLRSSAGIPRLTEATRLPGMPQDGCARPWRSAPRWPGTARLVRPWTYCAAWTAS